MLRLRRSFALRTIACAQHDNFTELLIFLGRLEAQVPHDHLQIFPGFAFLARIAEEKRGMIGDGELGSMPGWIAARARGHEIVKAAAKLGHGCVESQQIFCRDCSERDYNPFGWITAICRIKNGEQVSHSSRSGVRLPGGRHFTMFAM